MIALSNIMPVTPPVGSTVEIHVILIQGSPEFMATTFMYGLHCIISVKVRTLSFFRCTRDTEAASGNDEYFYVKMPRC